MYRAMKHDMENKQNASKYSKIDFCGLVPELSTYEFYFKYSKCPNNFCKF